MRQVPAFRQATWRPWTGRSEDRDEREHQEALDWPVGVEVSILGLLNGWVGLAERYVRETGSLLTEDDPVLGRAWVAMGNAIGDWLQWQTGRLLPQVIDDIVRFNLSVQVCAHCKGRGTALDSEAVPETTIRTCCMVCLGTGYQFAEEVPCHGQ